MIEQSELARIEAASPAERADQSQPRPLALSFVRRREMAADECCARVLDGDIVRVPEALQEIEWFQVLCAETLDAIAQVA